MSRWHRRPVDFKWQLSDWTLFSVSLPLQVRVEQISNETAPVQAAPLPPADELLPGSQGFLVRNVPIAAELPPISRVGDYTCYVPLQYQHCYIDLGSSFEDYQKKFSSKTRSTINRKIRKFAEHCGGDIRWKTYRRPEEMREFLRLARSVSKLTYQERLLDAGIPDTEVFAREAESLAAEQRVRAYILFEGEKPVSYLYCPVHDGVLIYAYLGYDPACMQMSVGTILQWLAVEQMFSEAGFRYFDFTEGQSEHKRLFATHQRLCANIFLVRRTLANTAIVYGHWYMDRLSGRLGAMLDRLGVKKRVKHLLRFARP